MKQSIIIAIALVAVAGGAYYLGTQKPSDTNTSVQTPASVSPAPSNQQASNISPRSAQKDLRYSVDL